MSATIEERVVAMKFDNSNFEKNVKTSMSTLEKLKNALNFKSAKDSVETLNQATKSLDLSSMSNSIDSISDRFSALGIVGMTVIQNLTNSAMNLAKNWASIIPDAIIQGGWKRATDVEQARFTLQGVVRDEQEVTAVMQDAKDSVDGTAYAYNEAAKAASVFAASGLRSGDQMQKVLKAVAGTAATANADYEGIAHIFQTIAGQGRVMGEQLNQFANRGINAAATVADFFNNVNSGTVTASDSVMSAIAEITEGYEVTEADIRDWASKSLISFDIFSEAMSTTFGDHAKDANKTFSGAMANIRAALARTGEAFFKHLVVQEGPAVQLFNSIRLKINQMNSVLDESAEAAANFVNSVILKLRDAVEDFPIMTVIKTVINFFKTLKNLAQPVIQVFSTMAKTFSQAFDFGSLTNGIYNLSESLVKLTDNFKFSEKNMESIRFAFKGVFDVISLVIDGIKTLLSLPVVEFTNPLQGLLDVILNIAGTIGLTLTKITVGIRESEKVKEAIDSLSNAFTKIHEVFKGAWTTIIDSFGVLGINIKSANTNIAEFISNLAVKTVEAFASAISFIADKFAYISEKVGPKVNEILSTVIGKIVDLIDRFKKFAKENDLGTKALNGFVAVLKLVSGLIVAPVYAIYKLIKAIADLPIVQEILSKLAESFKMIGEHAGKYLEMAGDKVWKFIDYLKDFDLKTFIFDVGKKISDFTDRFSKFLDKTSEGEGILSRFAEAVKKAWDNFNLLKGGVSAHTLYDEYGEPMEDADNKTDSFGNTISKVKDKLKEFFSTIDLNMVIVAIFAATMIAMVLSIKKLVEGFTSLVSSITGIASSISGFINSWKKKDHSKIIEFAEAIAILAASLFLISKVDPDRLWSSVAAMGAMAAGLTVMTGILALVSKSVKGKDAGKEFASLAMVMISLSASLVVLAAALKIMEGLDFRSVMKNVLALSAMGAVVSVLTIAITRFSKVGSIKQALVIMAFAFSMAKFAEAIKTLSTISYENISQNIKSIIVLFGMLAVLAFAASKIGVFSAVGLFAIIFVIDKMMPMITRIVEESHFGKIFDEMATVIRKNIDVVLMLSGLAAVMTMVGGVFGKGISKFGYGLTLISISMILMGKAIKSIGSIDPLKIEKGMSVVGKIMGLFSLLALALNIGGGGNHAIKIAAAINIMSLALYPLAGAMWIIGTMDARKVEQGLKAVSTLMAMFALIAAASSIGNSKASFGSIMAIVVGVLGIISEMIVLTLVPTDKIEASTWAIAGVMAGFALVIAAIGSMDKTSAGSVIAILEFIAGLLAMSYMLIKLSQQPWENMLAAGVSVTLVMLSLSKVIKTIGKMDVASVGKEKINSILKIGLILVEIGAALWLASMNPWDQILSGTAGIAVTLLAFGQVLKIISDDKNGFYFDSEKGKALVIAGLFLLEVAAALYAVSLNPWENLLASTVAMGVTLFAFAQVMESVSRSTFDVKKAGSLLLAGLVMGEVALALYFLAKQPWENMLASTLSLSAVLLAFSVALRILPKIDVGAAIDAAVSLIAFVGIIELFFTAVSILLGLLDEKAYNTIEKGFTRLANIGKFIGIAIGEFIGGIAVGMTNNLPAIADNLVEFSNRIKPFVDNMSKIGEDVFKGAASLAKSLLVLTGSNLLQALAEFFGAKTMDDFGNQIGKFGEGIAAFAKATSNIDATAVETAANAGLILATLMRALPNEGGKLAEWVGDNTIDKFNEDTLGGFGAGIKAFADKVKGLDANAVEAAVSAGLSLSYLMKALPNEGGLLAEWVGDNTIDKFNADTLGKFGDGIMAFASAVKGLDTDTVEAAASAGLSLAYLMKALPNEGGLLADMVGDNTINKFNKTTLGNFGEGIAEFADKVKDVTPDSVMAAASAGLLIAKLMDALPNEGGVLAYWVGENSISQFTKETLGPFGEGISAFAEAVEDITEDHVQAATYAYQVMRRLLAIELPNEGGVINAVKGFFAGKADAEKFKDKMKYLSEALNVFYSNTETLEIDRLKALFRVLESLADALTIVNSTDTSTIKDFAKNLKAAGDLGIDNFCKAFESADGRIKSAVDRFIDNVSTEMKSRSNVAKVSDALSYVVDIAIAAANGKANDLKEVGRTIGSNLSEGITDSYSGNAGYQSMFGVGNNSMSGLYDGMTSKTGDIVDYSDILSSDIYGNFDDALNFDSMYDLSSSGMEGLTKGFDIGSFNADTLTDNISSDIFKNFDDKLDYDAMFDFGNDELMGGLAKGIERGSSEPITLAGTKAEDIYNNIGDKLNNNKTYELMAGSVEGLRNGLDSPTMNDTIRTAGNKASSIYEGFSSKISETAGNILTSDFVKGLHNGLALAEDGGSYDVGRTCANIAGRMLDRMRERLDEHSPSKEAEEIGEFFNLGLVKGVEGTTGEVEDSVENLGDSSISALKDSMGYINDYISENLDLQPVIRPILDISDISNQMGAFNSLFNSNRIGLYGEFGGVDATNSDVVESINTLRSDLSDLTRVVGNLKVVMDTGTLVGAIAPSMDNALGAMAAYQERGM